MRSAAILSRLVESPMMGDSDLGDGTTRVQDLPKEELKARARKQVLDTLLVDFSDAKAASLYSVGFTYAGKKYTVRSTSNSVRLHGPLSFDIEGTDRITACKVIAAAIKAGVPQRQYSEFAPDPPTPVQPVP